MPERFLKVPHIQQTSSGDCLAACAAMMLEYVGFRADYARLLRILGTSELGTPHSRIKRLSNLYPDLLLTYKIGDLEDIVNYIDVGYPVTVFVDTKDLRYWPDSYGHAVVVTGYSDQIFYLNDPGFSESPKVVTFGNLELAWDAYEHFLAVIQRRQKPK